MLKKKITKEQWDELSETIQSCYIETDDGYELEIDDDDSVKHKQKLSEFRDSNIRLQKDLEKIKNDLIEKETKLKDFEEKQRKEKEKKMLDDNDIEGLVAEKTKRMRLDLENQITALQQKLVDTEAKTNDYKSSLARIKIDNAIQLEVGKVGMVKKGYMEDIISLGKRVFTMDENDEPVALDNRGAKIVGKDGVTPLSISEWAATLPTEKAAYFEDSTGGGATGNKGRGKRSGPKLSDISDPIERIKEMRRAQ